MYAGVTLLTFTFLIPVYCINSATSTFVILSVVSKLEHCIFNIISAHIQVIRNWLFQILTHFFFQRRLSIYICWRFLHYPLTKSAFSVKIYCVTPFQYRHSLFSMRVHILKNAFCLNLSILYQWVLSENSVSKQF